MHPAHYIVLGAPLLTAWLVCFISTQKQLKEKKYKRGEIRSYLTQEEWKEFLLLVTPDWLSQYVLEDGTIDGNKLLGDTKPIETKPPAVYAGTDSLKELSGHAEWEAMMGLVLANQPPLQSAPLPKEECSCIASAGAGLSSKDW